MQISGYRSARDCSQTRWNFWLARGLLHQLVSMEGISKLKEGATEMVCMWRAYSEFPVLPNIVTLHAVCGWYSHLGRSASMRQVRMAAMSTLLIHLETLPVPCALQCRTWPYESAGSLPSKHSLSQSAGNTRVVCMHDEAIKTFDKWR